MPPLNKKHKQKCQERAKQYTKTDFSKDLWTDEMRVTLDGPGGWACGWTTDPTSHTSLTEEPAMWGKKDDDMGWCY